MMYRKLLVIGTISTLLLASSLSAQGNCVGGACFVSLKKLKPTKVFQEKKEQMVIVKKPRFISSKNEFKHHNSTDSILLVKDSDLNKAFDIIVDGKITVVFPSYVMTEEEKVAYYREQRAIALNKKANEEANRGLRVVTQPIEKIEDKILNKNLPTSEYFCDNNKKPVRIKNSNLYECV